MHTTVSTGGTPQGVGCDRAAMRTSQRRRLRRTRCRTSSQVRAGACWVRVGGSRFLQTDPIPGGSANAYDYGAQDAINNSDLDGRSYLADGMSIDMPGSYSLPSWRPNKTLYRAGRRIAGYVRGQFSVKSAVGHLLSYQAQLTCTAFVLYATKGRGGLKGAAICKAIGVGVGSAWRRISK